MTEFEKLIEGYKRFHDNYFVSDGQLFTELALADSQWENDSMEMKDALPRQEEEKSLSRKF